MGRQIGVWAVAAAIAVFSAPSWGLALQTGYTVNDAFTFGLDPIFSGSGYLTYHNGTNRFLRGSGNLLQGADGTYYMLTTQHQIAGAPAGVSFDVGFGNDIVADITGGGLLGVSNIFLDPNWDGYAGNLHDRALLELIGTPVNATPYSLFTDELMVGDNIYVGGYGDLSNGSNSLLFLAGENRISDINGTALYPDEDGFEFNSLGNGGFWNEVGGLNGDSGGSILVERGGEFLLAGMMTSIGPGWPGFGYDTFFLPTHTMDDWIYSVIGAPAPVPEPATVTLLGMGLLSLAYARRRQRG